MAGRKKNPILKLYLGEKIICSYKEEGIEKSIKGIICDFDDINFILIKGDYIEKLISTANIISIKKSKRGDYNGYP